MSTPPVDNGTRTSFMDRVKARLTNNRTTNVTAAADAAGRAAIDAAVASRAVAPARLQTGVDPFTNFDAMFAALPVGARSAMPAPKWVRGIPNQRRGDNAPHLKGNDCYLNSIVQLLRVSPSFRRFLNEEDLHDPKLWCIGDFLQNFYEGDRNTVDVRAAKQFQRDVIGENIFNQEDPGDLLMTFLHGNPRKVKLMTIRSTALVKQGERPGTVELDGRAQPGERTEEDSYGFLSLEFGGVRKLNAMLERQWVMKEPGWDAPLSEGTQSELRLYSTATRFAEAPEQLTMQLKRFTYDGRANKISENVEIQEQYKIPLIGGGSADYELEALIVHQGISLENGHYVAYVREGEHWFEIDDAVVTYKSREEMFGRVENGVRKPGIADQAYIVQCRRADIKPYKPS